MAWWKLMGGLLSAVALRAFAQDTQTVAKVQDASLVWSSRVDQGLFSVAWSPDGQALAVGGRGKVRVYRAPDFALLRVLDTEQNEIWGLEWSPDGRLLASGGKDGTLQLWQEGRIEKKFLQGGWITDVAWNPDGTSLMAVDFTGLAKEWDIEGFLRASIQLDADGLGVDWSPRGRLFAASTGHNASRLLLFDSESGELRWRRQDVAEGYRAPFGYGLDEVNSVRYSPNGRWLATTHQDGRIMVSSAETGQTILSAGMHKPGLGGSRRLAWSPDGVWLVTSGEDGRVNVVHFPDGKDRIDLLQSGKAVWAVGWSSDNRFIAAVGEEGRIWVWSAASVTGTAPSKYRTIRGRMTQRETRPE